MQTFEEVIKENENKKLSTPKTSQETLKLINKMHLGSMGKKLQDKAAELDDIKDKKNKLSKKLIQMASEIHQVNEAISDFTFAASHDLIEPLRKISSFSSRLREVYGEDLDERQEVYLNVIERSSQKLNNNITGLADFARITNTNLNYESISLNELFQVILEKFAVKIRKSKAQIKVDELPSLVSDKDMLKELFRNLISNSLKFKKDLEPPTIHITGQQSDDGFIEVSIKDFGIGFNEKYTQQIFKPFQRLEKNIEEKGSGIGLTLCQKIVSRLEGSISAISSPGEGSTFSVKLPLKPSGSENVKILIVDDSEDSQVVMKTLLDMRSHETSLAPNGIIALEMLNENVPDLIITDITMPEMDGFEFCRKVRANPKWDSVAIIVYTGSHTSQADQQLGLSLGISQYILKPQEPDVLIEIIEKFLKK